MIVDPPPSQPAPPQPMSASSANEAVQRIVTTFISTSATQIPAELLQCESAGGSLPFLGQHGLIR